MDNYELYIKASKIISSCNTLEQLRVAGNYVKLTKHVLPSDKEFLDSPKWSLHMALFRKKWKLKGELECLDNGEEHW